MDLNEFYNASFEQRSGLLLRSQAELKQAFGVEAFRELQAMYADQPEHLSAGTQPILLVPGIMGSLLRGRYQPGELWWIDHETAEGRSRLDQLGLEDGEEPQDKSRHVDPFDVHVSYAGFFAACMKSDSFVPVRLPYDWRKSLDSSTDTFAKGLEDCCHRFDQPSVDVVCHSMGGLVARVSLMRHPSLWDRVRRLVFLGTPHYGSTRLAYYLRDHLRGTWRMWLLGQLISRPTFRSLWGAVGLIPAPVGVYPGTRPGQSIDLPDPNAAYLHPCVDFDIYQADAWPFDMIDAETAVFRRTLDYTRNLHQELYSWHQSLDPEHLEKMLVIAGVDQPTPFMLQGEQGLVNDIDPLDVHRNGDDSVTLASALLENVEQRLIKAQHGALPNTPGVYHEVFRFLRGQPLELPSDVRDVYAEHLDVAPESASDTPMLDGSGLQEGPEDEPTKAELDELLRRLKSGDYPEIMSAKIL